MRALRQDCIQYNKIRTLTCQGEKDLYVGRMRAFLVLLLCVVLQGCGGPEAPSSLKTSSSPTPVLVFGDSLSAAYQMDPDKGWVNLLEQRMHEEGWLNDEQFIFNASVSGETTQGGLERFEQALDDAKPAVVVLELGANDALRRQSMEQMRSNLSEMITMAQGRGAQVFLVGVDLPAKFFFVSTDHFTGAYRELASQHEVILVPNLLEDVNSNRSMMMDDGLHPNPSGQPQIVDNVWPHLQDHVL